ncbi:GGDEF domain-containing protein [Butyrivibrio sp. YAB3001]|uniref:GGDEF domain-containing protein n=1 Tax=Butyrivibrio sp. YAB3001 TaxID=1520812 RepID=UPI0008F67331|nr:GGDEF domain-containing protein [Butyrivibrio sp. YAB3001]SFB82636.1 diguanylate cyclase (GGDEF) domain-containing protein [Butyrivibrio sp. YAB3001]
MNIVAIAIADFVGLMLLIAMLFSSHIRRATNYEEFRLFTLIAFLSAVACVVDFWMFFCDGREGIICRLVNLFGNTYCFIANPVFAIAWCQYTDYKLYHSKSRLRRIYRIAAIPGFIMALSTIINLFYPVVFFIDDNNVYHRLPFSYMFYLVEAGYLIYSIYVIKKYEERYDKVRFFPLPLMLGPIAAGCLLQVLFYGVSLMWVSISIGLTSIYMSMQNEFSYLDTLTGLYNRTYLDYLFEIYSKDPKASLGGVMIDVDYFKEINDTYGHSVGDEALIDVARIIRLGKTDKAIPIRFAGDEFILLMKGSNDESMKKLIQGLRDELKLFNETEGRQYKLSLSMGYTIFDPDRDTIDTFFKKMDDNMYSEKVKKHSERV